MRRSPLVGKRLLLVTEDPEVAGAVLDDLADPIVGEVPVVEVAGGTGASERIRSGALDLVLVDAAHAGGWSQLAHAVAAGVPAIVVATSGLRSRDMSASRQGGAIAYIPLDRENGIEQIVDEVLACRAAGRDPWELVLAKLGTID